jgi:hypothetical protein
VGPAGTGYTVWGISDTSFSGGDNTVYFSAGSSDTSTWTQVSDVGAVQVAVSPTTGTPWLLACSGHLTMGSLNGSGDWVFAEVAPFPWNGDGGIPDAGKYQAGALHVSSLSVAPAPSHVPDAGKPFGPWVVSTTANGSGGDTILDLVLANSTENATWDFVPGAAIQVSISPTGVPYIVDNNGYVYSAPSYRVQ